MKSSQKFAARAKRTDDHDFTSIDWGSELGQAVVDSFRESGEEIEVDLKIPDIYVRSELRGRDFWVGVDTTGERSLSQEGLQKV